MPYFALTPDVAGELGRHTELDRSTHPPVVLHLHVVFSDWLGDDLLANYPCFLVTEKMGERLLPEQLTGFELADVEVGLSPEAVELLEGQELPEFRWLKISGVAGSEDFGLIPGHAKLVVSDRALEVLREGSLEYCDIEDYEG
jgi:hypothetical protein